MKGLKRTFSLILIFITLAAASGLVSCSSSGNGSTFLVYYTNSDGDDIVYRESEIEDVDILSSEKLINILLNKMFEEDLNDTEIHSAKPSWVGLKSFNIEDNLVTFDFDSKYREMSNVQEIMLRAAMVLTVIQVPEIAQVMFTIDSDALTDSSGRSIGVMNAGNFVDILLSEQGMLKQETDLYLYFADETQSKLVPARYHFTISNSNTSMEEYILQQLKTGPSIEGNTFRTISSDVNIISVATSDYVCYVNFDKKFLEQEQTCSDELMVYSIVNSLCNLPYVNSVQFMVDGSTDVILHTFMDLSKPLKRNRELEQ